MTGGGTLLPVEDALARLLALVAPLPPEDVPLREAGGRVLARAARARTAQPPFDASAMDGYAVRAADARPGARLRVAGRAEAGTPWDGHVGAGEAVRVFTGAPVPAGADRVVIQEDVTARGAEIVLHDDLDAGPYVRPAGADFAMGAELPPGPLTPARIALAAAMGHPALPCARRPEVAILPTGDELVPPGADLGPGRIHGSNGFGLAALVAAAGAAPRLLPTARDDADLVAAALARARGADLIVTTGGASVGERDLVAGALAAAGTDMAFHRVAMRPGKPLMAGRLGDAAVIGLPGNPVSALVTGHVFVLPMLRRMLGLPPEAPAIRAPLAAPMAANGARRHYARAALADGALHPADRQDSALLSVLARATHLIVRAPHSPAARAGEEVTALSLALPDAV